MRSYQFGHGSLSEMNVEASSGMNGISSLAFPGNGDSTYSAGHGIVISSILMVWDVYLGGQRLKNPKEVIVVHLQGKDKS
jgi:hypothetical protein